MGWSPPNPNHGISLQQAIRSLDELLDAIGLERHQLPALDESPDFPLLVPREFVARIKREIRRIRCCCRCCRWLASESWWRDTATMQ